MADIAESSRKSIDGADLTRYFDKYGENVWAAFHGSLDGIVATAAAPVIEKYTGVLGAADVFTESTKFQVMQSIRPVSDRSRPKSGLRWRSSFSYPGGSPPASRTLPRTLVPASADEYQKHWRYRTSSAVRLSCTR